MKEFPFDPYDFFGYLAAGIVVLVGLELTIGVPHVQGRDLAAFDLVVIGLLAYVVGQMIATPSQWILEDFVVSCILKRPVENLLRPKDSRRPLLRWLAFPGYYSSLPESVQKRVISKAVAEGLSEASADESLFLHVRFRDYIRQDEALMARLGAFLNKYGFNRNLSFVAFVFAIAVMLSKPFDLSTDVTRYALLSLGAGVLLFYRYIKFFRQYSYELFNAYAGRDSAAVRPAKTTAARKGGAP